MIIGCGSRSQLPALLERLGLRRGVLVTDAYFVHRTPWVREYVQAARERGVDTLVYDGGLPDPTTVLCDAATMQLREALAGRLPITSSRSAAAATSTSRRHCA